MFHVKHITAINARIIAHTYIKNHNNTSTYAIINHNIMFLYHFTNITFFPQYATLNYQIAPNMFHVKHYIDYFIESNNSQLGKYRHYCYPNTIKYYIKLP